MSKGNGGQPRMTLNLQQSKKNVPDDVKHTAACTRCKLIMNDETWQSLKFACPNCHGDKTEVTKTFSGIVSLIAPTHSWVAKWHGL